MAKFNLADILGELNPSIDSDLLKAARYFTKGERDIIKLLSKPGKAEKRGRERLKNVKSEEALTKQIGELFGATAAAGQQAIGAGQAMGTALSEAITSAASGAGALAGGDNRVAQLIADSAGAAQGTAREAGTALSGLGQAAVGSSSVQQAAAIANALARRSDEVSGIQDLIDEAVTGREAALLEARAGKQGSFLQMVGTLLGFKPTSTGGYGRGTTTTTTGNTPPVIRNIHGQQYFAGDVITPSGYFIQDTAGTSSGGPVVPQFQVTNPNNTVVPNVYRPGYGPSGTQGPRR